MIGTSNSDSNTNIINIHSIVTNAATVYPCHNCKQSCEDTNSIMCDFCGYWYHDECTFLNKNRLNQFRRNPNLKYRCHICSRVRFCGSCKISISNKNSIHCFNCFLSLCSNCSLKSSSEISIINSKDDLYYLCQECSDEQICPLCNKISQNDCIMCDHCKKWIHYKCSKLTKTQINRYTHSNDVYYCPTCISQCIPFTRIRTSQLADLNCSVSTTVSA